MLLYSVSQEMTILSTTKSEKIIMFQNSNYFLPGLSPYVKAHGLQATL